MNKVITGTFQEIESTPNKGEIIELPIQKGTMEQQLESTRKAFYKSPEDDDAFAKYSKTLATAFQENRHDLLDIERDHYSEKNVYYNNTHENFLKLKNALFDAFAESKIEPSFSPRPD